MREAFCLGYDFSKEQAKADFDFNALPGSPGLDLDGFCFEIIEEDPQHFLEAVGKLKDHICEGDVYQANLCRKYFIRCNQGLDDSAYQKLASEIYSRLKHSNPAPYAAHMSTKRYEIISCSPELFLKIEKLSSGEFKLSTSPIKGTVSSGQEKELTLSEKEQAEHIMIVDLMRNDLGRICKTGSIKVEEQMAVHKFTELSHLVSTITGILDKNYIDGKPDLDKIFAEIFPGGSITGAPKHRAMQIISELEKQPRGLYTGIMGYYDDEKGFGEFSILIRTLVIDKEKKEISLGVGAGITAMSDPEYELNETRLKAKKILEIFA